MSERVLVTGSSGFVGIRLCAYLETQGYDVYGCDVVTRPGEKTTTCDIAKAESVKEMLLWAGPLDHVIHLAAMTFLPEAESAPVKVIDVNINGTINLIQSMWEHTPGARLLFISSSEVYGSPQFTPITEEHPLSPKNPYSISKAAADQYCRYCFESAGMPIVRIRPFNHSGNPFSCMESRISVNLDRRSA